MPPARPHQVELGVEGHAPQQKLVLGPVATVQLAELLVVYAADEAQLQGEAPGEVQSDPDVAKAASGDVLVGALGPEDAELPESVKIVWRNIDEIQRPNTQLQGWGECRLNGGSWTTVEAVLEEIGKL